MNNSNIFWIKVKNSSTLKAIFNSSILGRLRKESIYEYGKTNSYVFHDFFNDKKSFWVHAKTDDDVIEMIEILSEEFSTPILAYWNQKYVAFNSIGKRILIEDEISDDYCLVASVLEEATGYSFNAEEYYELYNHECDDEINDQEENKESSDSAKHLDTSPNSCCHNNSFETISNKKDDNCFCKEKSSTDFVNNTFGKENNVVPIDNIDLTSDEEKYKDELKKLSEIFDTKKFKEEISDLKNEFLDTYKDFDFDQNYNDNDELASDFFDDNICNGCQQECLSTCLNQTIEDDVENLINIEPIEDIKIETVLMNDLDQNNFDLDSFKPTPKFEYDLNDVLEKDSKLNFDYLQSVKIEDTSNLNFDYDKFFNEFLAQNIVMDNKENIIEPSEKDEIIFDVDSSNLNLSFEEQVANEINNCSSYSELEKSLQQSLSEIVENLESIESIDNYLEEQTKTLNEIDIDFDIDSELKNEKFNDDYLSFTIKDIQENDESSLEENYDQENQFVFNSTSLSEHQPTTISSNEQLIDDSELIVEFDSALVNSLHEDKEENIDLTFDSLQIEELENEIENNSELNILSDFLDKVENNDLNETQSYSNDLFETINQDKIEQQQEEEEITLDNDLFDSLKILNDDQVVEENISHNFGVENDLFNQSIDLVKEEENDFDNLMINNSEPSFFEELINKIDSNDESKDAFITELVKNDEETNNVNNIDEYLSSFEKDLNNNFDFSDNHTNSFEYNIEPLEENKLTHLEQDDVLIDKDSSYDYMNKYLQDEELNENSFVKSFYEEKKEDTNIELLSIDNKSLNDVEVSIETSDCNNSFEIANENIDFDSIINDDLYAKFTTKELDEINNESLYNAEALIDALESNKNFEEANENINFDIISNDDLSLESNASADLPMQKEDTLKTSNQSNFEYVSNLFSSIDSLNDESLDIHLNDEEQLNKMYNYNEIQDLYSQHFENYEFYSPQATKKVKDDNINFDYDQLTKEDLSYSNDSNASEINDINNSIEEISQELVDEIDLDSIVEENIEDSYNVDNLDEELANHSNENYEDVEEVPTFNYDLGSVQTIDNENLAEEESINQSTETTSVYENVYTNLIPDEEQEEYQSPLNHVSIELPSREFRELHEQNKKLSEDLSVFLDELKKEKEIISNREEAIINREKKLREILNADYAKETDANISNRNWRKM